MLKRIEIIDDFGQFVAAIKAAEKLDLRYCVERRARRRIQRLSPIARVQHQMATGQYLEQVDDEVVEYVLEILPDEQEVGAQQSA